MRAFLEEHQEKRAEVEDLLDDLDLDVETDRTGDGLVPTEE
jgi:tryptophanyl-tRNA synthetase